MIFLMDIDSYQKSFILLITILFYFWFEIFKIFRDVITVCNDVVIQLNLTGAKEITSDLAMEQRIMWGIPNRSRVWPPNGSRTSPLDPCTAWQSLRMGSCMGGVVTSKDSWEMPPSVTWQSPPSSQGWRGRTSSELLVAQTRWEAKLL